VSPTGDGGAAPARLVHHVALADEWDRVVAGEIAYRWSTIEAPLDDVGFVHCAFAHQVAGVIERYYEGRVDEIVVLTVDPERSASELRVENTSGGTELFPHLYGPITLEVVVAVEPLARFLGRDGTAGPLPG
jgi:glutathione S-transferase